MPTQHEFEALKTDLDQGIEAARYAYTSVSNWAIEVKAGLGEAVAGQIDDLIDNAARTFIDAEGKMGTLVQIAETRRGEAQQYTIDYASWFRSNSQPLDPTTAPVKPDYVDYGW